MIIDKERLKYIGSMLLEIKPHIRNLIEKDPQYIAIRNLSSSRGADIASVLVVSNALISYQLSIEGEKYWTMFSEYFSNQGIDISIESFKRFLHETGCVRNIDQKLSRLNRLLSSRVVDRLINQGLYYCKEIRGLLEELAYVLRTNMNSKTLVFASKMYGYLCIANQVDPSWNDIPIPIDYRNAVLSLASCIIRLRPGEETKEVAKKLTSGSYSKIIQQAWSEVCNSIGLPCLELDTFTWLFTRAAINARFNPHLTREIFNKKYGICISPSLSSALLECACYVL